MIYFQYITFFIILTAVLIFVRQKWLRIEEDHFHKLTLRGVWEQNRGKADIPFINSAALYQILKILRQSKTGKTARLKLAEGKPRTAETFLRKKDKIQEALLLAAHYNQRKVLPQLEKLLKKNPDSSMIAASLAEIYSNLGEHDKAQLAINRIVPKKAPAYVQGVYWLYQSREAAQNGDMLTATQTCGKAVYCFNRCRAYTEEAQAYLWQGTLYRICFVEDVANFMLETARKIFALTGYKAGEAEAAANLGMLMTAQERFEEAEALFDDALQIARLSERKNIEAEIINQTALMKIVSGAYTAAEKHLRQAAKIHSEEQNHIGLAFSYELRANLYLKQQNYDKTFRFAQKAAKLYNRSENRSAYLESLYLMAQACFAKQQTKEAETFLRQIIKLGRQNAGSFHIANAFSLLGLIYLQQGEFLRAKGLFQQSLEQEQKNDRCSGIAADYANIALIELRSGHKNEALKNMRAAAEYAEAAEDETLSEWLKAEIIKLESQLN